MSRRTYLLRSYVYCQHCGRRMEGTTRKGAFVYFRCRPRPTSGHDAHHRWPGHPADIYVSEAKLLAGILKFFSERVFGERRRELLAADLNEAANEGLLVWQDRLLAMERALKDLEVRRARLIHALETTDDPDGVLAQDVNRRLAEIAREHNAKVRDLDDLRSSRPRLTEQGPELLDRIGRLSPSELERAPEGLLRALFDAFALKVCYDADESVANCEITVDEETVPTVVSTADLIAGSRDGDRLGISLARWEGFEPPTF